MTTFALSRFHLYSIHKCLKAIGNKIWEIEHIPSRHMQILQERYELIRYQLFMLVVLAVMFPISLVVNWATGGFFDYPYLSGGLPSIETLATFWPLGLWCGLLLVVANNHVRSSYLDERLWVTGMFTGNLAGVWEEIGYRYLFILPAMVVVAFTNWLLSGWFAWIFLGLFAISTLAIFVDDTHKARSGIKSLLLLILMIYIWDKPDPWYWAYQHVVMPIVNTVSFGSFTDIFENTERHAPLMVMGAILANNWFRDGHKYQGLVGWLDSWLVGFVLMYACFTHGLLTAIALHCLWNSLVYTSIYCKRKLYG